MKRNRYYGLFLSTDLPYKHLQKIIRKFNYHYYERASPEKQLNLKLFPNISTVLLMPPRWNV